MSAHETVDPWTRLGGLLRKRRAQINPRYANRTLFCTETGIDYRVAFDLEKNKRQNYTDDTLAAAETAYQLEPGSIEAALAGGDLRPLPADATVRPETVRTRVSIPPPATSVVATAPAPAADQAGIDSYNMIMEALRRERQRQEEQQERIAELERDRERQDQELAKAHDELRELREARDATQHRRSGGNSA